MTLHPIIIEGTAPKLMVLLEYMVCSGEKKSVRECFLFLSLNEIGCSFHSFNICVCFLISELYIVPGIECVGVNKIGTVSNHL